MQAQQKRRREGLPARTSANRLPGESVRSWIKMTDVASTHGATMLELLDEELQRVEAAEKESLSDGMAEYISQLEYVYNSVAGSLLSSCHRRLQNKHLHEGMGELYHPDALEDVDVCTESMASEENEESAEGGDALVEKIDSKATVAIAQEAISRKREEAKRRRMEDGMMLVREKKVKDDKGNILETIGPFPPPRLAIRSTSSDHQFPSRKTLSQKTVIVSSPASSSPPEEFVPATVPIPANDHYDVTSHLTHFLHPLSLDSLKKISESAKISLRSGTCDEYVQQIVKGAARLGCEQACILMEKYKIIDAVASSCHATPPDVMAHMGANVDFLVALPENLREMLGPALGMPKENSSVPEMWERIVSMGLCMVLANIRLRPLKRIVQELGIRVPDGASTEMHCQAIVYSVFPRESQRVKQTRNSKKSTEVCFSLKSGHGRTIGDMGFITFTVQHVSNMRKDCERHYSPEFEFGELRWSLLCMANKDNLALYLCQTGSVHCKFVITVLNDNPDDSICNEGTQRFNSASIENDWGFNSVISFASLLEPSAGFWHSSNDSIDVEVGIVFVESAKPQAAKSTSAKSVQKSDGERINQNIANQLLELERQENLQRKLKNELSKLVKEEERVRKELSTRLSKSMVQLNENRISEKAKIVRELHEKERKEQQEVKRRQERLRVAAEKAQELENRAADLTQEIAEITQRKKKLSAEVREMKKHIEKTKGETSQIDVDIAAVQTKLQSLAAKNATDEELLVKLREESARMEAEEKAAAEEEEGRAKSHQGTEFAVDILEAVQQSLASIIGT